MDSENNQMEQQTVQCRNGCGFYGNAGTEGYCSVCYKEAIKKKQQPPTGMPASLAPTPNSMATLSLQGESSSAAGAAGGEGGNETSNSNNNLNTGSPTVLTVPSQIIAKSAQQSDSEMADATPSAASNNTSVDVQMSTPSTIEAVASTSATAAAAATAGGDESNDGGAGGKKKKNRCGVCKKKLGLTGFSCRCEGLFCPVHRYSDKHDCKFDYKELGAEEIKKSNPVVVASKIQKI